MTSRALLVGINYKKYPDYQLKAAYNDVELMKELLRDYYNFDTNNIVELNDKVEESLYNATFFNIVSNIKKIIEVSTEDDFIVLYFSGHGKQIEDRNGDEIDNKDEVFLPSNFTKSAVINDDLFNELLKESKCPVLLIFDCCHSGTMSDLYYNYPIKLNKLEINLLKEKENNLADKKIISISSCLDGEESVEEWYPKKMQNLSVFTQQFVRVIKELVINGDGNITYEKLRERMCNHDVLKFANLSMSNMLLKESNIFANWEDEETKRINENRIRMDLLKKEVKDLRYENKKVMKMNKKLAEVLDKYSTAYNNSNNSFTNVLYKIE